MTRNLLTVHEAIQFVMARLAILLLVLIYLTGCKFSLKAGARGEGFTYVANSDLENGEESPYAALLQECIDENLLFFGLPSNRSIANCTVEVDDDKLNIVLAPAATPGFEFQRWSRGPRSVGLGRSSPYLNVSTAGFSSNEALADFLSNPQETFVLRPVFRELTDDEKAREPASACQAGAAYAKGFVLNTTSTLELPSQRVTIVSSEQTKLFKLLDPQTAEVTREANFTFLDPSGNTLGSGQSINVLHNTLAQVRKKGAKKPKAAATKTFSQNTATSFVNGSRSFADREFNTGSIFPMDLDLENPSFSTEGIVSQYQGPQNGGALEEFSYTTEYTYRGYGSVSTGSGIDVLTCDFDVVEILTNSGGVSFISESENRLLGYEASIAGVLGWRRAVLPDGQTEVTALDSVSLDSAAEILFNW